MAARRFVPGAASLPSGGVRHLVIEEVADRLGYSVSGIRKLVYSGRIPADCYFQLGGPGSRLLFRAEALDRLEREAG